MPVAPLKVNDVSSVTRINHESHLSCQAQYLVKFEGDSFAHCTGRFMCWDYQRDYYFVVRNSTL